MISASSLRFPHLWNGRGGKAHGQPRVVVKIKGDDACKVSSHRKCRDGGQGLGEERNGEQSFRLGR